MAKSNKKYEKKLSELNATIQQLTGENKKLVKENISLKAQLNTVSSASKPSDTSAPSTSKARARNVVVESTEEAAKLPSETHETAKGRGKRAPKEIPEEKVEEPQEVMVPVKKGRARKNDESSEKSEEPSVEESSKGRSKRREKKPYKKRRGASKCKPKKVKN